MYLFGKEDVVESRVLDNRPLPHVVVRLPLEEEDETVDDAVRHTGLRVQAPQLLNLDTVTNKLNNWIDLIMKRYEYKYQTDTLHGLT